MTGICEGCPSSLLTVKLAVEATIRELAPEVATIDVEGITDTGAAAIKSKGLKDDLSSVERSWISIDNPEEFPSDKLTPAEAGGSSIVPFRIEGRLYAYRDTCPVCGSTIQSGSIVDGMLVCPSCGRSYDPRLAGR